MVLPTRQVAGPLRDLRAVCRVAGVTYSQDVLGGTDGLIEAMLVPLSGDRFGIAVDPTPRGGWLTVPPAVRRDLRRHRVRFRVAHELGHTFFYAREGERPRRIVPDSPRQEAFCDTFARSLLVSPRSASTVVPSAAAVLKLAREFDVSVEVAARAVSSAHPDVEVGVWWWPTDGGPEIQWRSDKCTLTAEDELDRATAHGHGRSAAMWLADRRQLVAVAA